MFQKNFRKHFRKFSEYKPTKTLWKKFLKFQTNYCKTFDNIQTICENFNVQIKLKILFDF